MTHVAILGAGVAGLGAALALRRAGIEPTVFEASPRIGGRVSTIERGGTVFDDGAQFIRTETPAAEQLLLRELPSDALFDIGRDVRPFDARGVVGPGDPSQNGMPKWGYRGGLRTLPHLLAAASHADVRLGWPATELTWRDGRWGVVGPRGEARGFHAVLVTLTPAAATSLLRRTGDPGASVYERGHHRTIVSVAFEPASPPRAPGDAYALVNTDRKHAVSWLAFESAKPGHVPDDREVLVAQMAHSWSAPRMGLPDAEIAGEAVARCRALLDTGLAPRWWHVTRWREALPDATTDASASDEERGIFFAGDAFAGGRVHLAIESGLAAGARIARRLDAQS